MIGISRGLGALGLPLVHGCVAWLECRRLAEPHCEAAYDTFFFMTDGTPTAGKLQKPDEILAAVREWNRTAKVVIHCVGVGDAADADFLGRLAAENGGVFVKR